MKFEKIIRAVYKKISINIDFPLIPYPFSCAEDFNLTSLTHVRNLNLSSGALIAILIIQLVISCDITNVEFENLYAASNRLTGTTYK